MGFALLIPRACESGHAPTGRMLDLGRWNFPWHDYLIGAAGHLALLGSGYLYSMLFPAQTQVDPRLTLRGWLAARRSERDDARVLAAAPLHEAGPGVRD